MLSKTFRYRVDFFVLLFFTFAAAIIGDNATEALILSQYTSAQISKMFSVNAIILFLFSLFSLGIVDRFNRAKLFQAFLVLYGVVIVLAWYAALHKIGWIYLPLFSIAYSGKIFSFFFVWTMANDVTDARQGLRDFPIIASGGTLGAIITTFAIPSIVSAVSTSQLLLIWLVPLVIAFFLAGSIRKRYAPSFLRRHEGKRSIAVSPVALVGNLKILVKEPLLRGMAITYFLIFFLLFNQQYLFYSVVKEKLWEADDISRFLGYFTGISMSVTFLIQLLVAAPITRKLGVIRTLYLLPAAMTVAFVAIFIGGTSWSSIFFYVVISGVILRIAFFDSFFSPSYQNFFSSLPAHLRGNSKLAIDGVVKPVAMIGSTLWIAFVPQTPVSRFILSIAAVVSLVTMIRLKKRYISTLVNYLSGYRNNSALSISQEAHLFNTREGLAQLEKVLREGIYEIQRFAVDLCVTIDSQKSIALLTDGFYERSGEIQAHITTVIANSVQPEVVPFLYDVLSLTPYPRVVANTIWSLGELGHADSKRFIPFLKSETPRIRGNAIVVMAKRGDLSLEEQELLLRAMLCHPNENIRAAGLWASSQVEVTRELRTDLLDFWKSDYRKIIHNIFLWRQYLAAINAMGDKMMLEKLSRYFDELDELKQQVFLEGLILFGQRHGIESLVFLENNVRGSVQGVVVEAIADSETHMSPDQIERVSLFAEKEYENAVLAYDMVTTLSAETDSAYVLLRETLIEQELYLHVRNLFNSALLLDRSGKLLAVRSHFMRHNGTILPQVAEIFDTIRSNRVNQLLVSYSEIDRASRPRLSRSMVLRKSRESGAKLVREIVEYIQNRGTA